MATHGRSSLADHHHHLILNFVSRVFLLRCCSIPSEYILGCVIYISKDSMLMFSPLFPRIIPSIEESTFYSHSLLLWGQQLRENMNLLRCTPAVLQQQSHTERERGWRRRRSSWRILPPPHLYRWKDLLLLISLKWRHFPSSSSSSQSRNSDNMKTHKSLPMLFLIMYRRPCWLLSSASRDDEKYKSDIHRWYGPEQSRNSIRYYAFHGWMYTSTFIRIKTYTSAPFIFFLRSYRERDFFFVWSEDVGASSICSL